MRRSLALVATTAVAVSTLALPAADAIEAGDPVDVVTSAPATCAGVASCVIDMDVPLPDAVLLPTGEAWSADPDAAPANRVRVILPPGYDASDEVTHPVVLLLHGAGDAHEVWVENTDIEDFVATADFDGAAPVIVMPSGGGRRGESGWYSDWVDPTESWDWETFHMSVLVPWIDATFDTHGDAAHRAVVGLSMGGFGAVSYAGRHPDLFSAIGSYSGALDTQFNEPVSGAAFKVIGPFFGTPDERVWGNQLVDHDRWTFHNPTAMARAGRLASFDGRIWIRTGTGEPDSVPTTPDEGEAMGGKGVEMFIHQLNQSFMRAAADGGLSGIDYAEYPGAAHEWSTWETALHDTLVDIVAAID